MKRLRTLKLFQIFSTEIKKSKTYSGWCPFKGLSNGTTLMQIQSGRTVPLKAILKNWNKKQLGEGEAKLKSLGSEKRHDFDCFASKRNSKNLKQKRTGIKCLCYASARKSWKIYSSIAFRWKIKMLSKISNVFYAIKLVFSSETIYS